jgi:hypothetical protein
VGEKMLKRMIWGTVVATMAVGLAPAGVARADEPLAEAPFSDTPARESD